MSHWSSVWNLVFSLLVLSSVSAHSLGRQRRVQTSATARGTARSPFVLPFWNAVFASNDEYIESAIEHPYHPELQPRHRHTDILADEKDVMTENLEDIESRRGDRVNEDSYLDFGAGRASDVGSQLLLAQSVVPVPTQLPPPALASLNSQLLLGRQLHTGVGNEGRMFKQPAVYLIMMGGGGNGSGNMTNTNNNNITNILPAAAAGTRSVFLDSPSNLYRQPQPYEFFRQRQDGATPQAYSSPAGNANWAGNGPREPLVPVSLGNNQVAYVPLNLVVLAAAAAQQAPIPKREPDSEGFEAETPSAEVDGTGAADNLMNSNLFGSRRRWTPTTTSYAPLSPWAAFRKSFQRPQYV